MVNSNKISKNILLLSICNIFWGFIPLPATKLFEEYSSFLVIFSRFIMMGIIILLLVVILVTISKYRDKQSNPILYKHLFYYIKSKNKSFFNLPQWAYLLITAIFGFNTMTILFFWGLKSIGAIITSIGVIISLIIVSLVNWGRGKEEMSKFKALYLITLIGATIILGLASNENNDNLSSQGFSWSNLLIVLAYGLFLSFFVITSSVDRLTKREYKYIRLNSDFKLIRTLFKLGILAIFSAIMFVPMLIILRLVSKDISMINEINTFFSQLNQIFNLIFSLNGMILIIGCTIIPYFLYYFLAANWPKHTSFDLWVGVLQLIEPIINLILGITVLNEEFPITWLIVIVFLMMIAIFTKYLSETEAQIFAIILLKIEPMKNYDAIKQVFRIKAVKQVKNLIGDFDLQLNSQIHSAVAFNKFITEKILSLPGLIEYKLLLITGNELDRTIPDV